MERPPVKITKKIRTKQNTNKKIRITKKKAAGEESQELLRRQMIKKLTAMVFDLIDVRDTMDDLPGMHDAQKHVQATIALLHNAEVSLWKNGVPWG